MSGLRFKFFALYDLPVSNRSEYLSRKPFNLKNTVPVPLNLLIFCSDQLSCSYITMNVVLAKYAYVYVLIYCCIAQDEVQLGSSKKKHNSSVRPTRPFIISQECLKLLNLSFVSRHCVSSCSLYFRGPRLSHNPSRNKIKV